MQTHQYRTNLRCGACLEAIRPSFDREIGPGQWGVDLASPDKVLTVPEGVPPARVVALLEQAGYKSLGEVEPGADQWAHAHRSPGPAALPEEEKPVTYYPLALLILFLLAGTALIQLRLGQFDGVRAMADFMGLFFVAFGFFKLLDLPGFASTYQGYDLIARRFPAWGYVYPFVEVSLGAAYLLGWQPLVVNLVTLVLLSVGAVGVLRAQLDQKKIRCACLGTVFNLPMTTVSLAEDVVMAAMAGIMLLM
jgi:hypothetical protein